MQAESLRTSTTVLTIGLLSDLSMTGVKGVLGVLAGSGALISDAVHSLADVMVSVGSIVATRLASAPADSKHPYGHGKFDSLGSLAISAMLTATGASIGLGALQDLLSAASATVGVGGGMGASTAATAASSSTSLISNSPILSDFVASAGLSVDTATALALASCLLAVAVKEVIYRWTMDVGMKLRSQTLVANAYHHRADSLSSVVAAVGIGGAYMGFPFLDPLAALVIAGWIGKAGSEIGLTAGRELIDERLDDATIAAAVDVVGGRGGHIRAVGKVRSRRMGPSVILEMEVAVSPSISVAEAHAIASSARAAIFRERPEVSEAILSFVPAAEGGGVKLPKLLSLHSSAASDKQQQQQQARDPSNAVPANETMEASSPSSSAQERDAAEEGAGGAAPSLEQNLSIAQTLLKKLISDAPGIRFVTRFEVHPETLESSALHVHAGIALEPDMKVREAMAVLRRVKALVAAFKSERGKGGEAWHVVEADIQLEIIAV